MKKYLFALLLCLAAFSAAVWADDKLTPAQTQFVEAFRKAVDKNDLDALAAIACMDGLDPTDTQIAKTVFLQEYLGKTLSYPERVYTFHAVDDDDRKFVQQMTDLKGGFTMEVDQVLWISGPDAGDRKTKMLLGKKGDRLLIVCFRLPKMEDMPKSLTGTNAPAAK